MPSPRSELTNNRPFDKQIESLTQVTQKDNFHVQIGKHVSSLTQSLQCEHEIALSQREEPLWAAIRKLQEENKEFRKQLNIQSLDIPLLSRPPSRVASRVSQTSQFGMCAMGEQAPPSFSWPPAPPSRPVGTKLVIPSRLCAQELEPLAEQDEEVVFGKQGMKSTGLSIETAFDTTQTENRLLLNGIDPISPTSVAEDDVVMFALWEEWTKEGPKTQAEKVDSGESLKEVIKRKTQQDLETHQKDIVNFYPGYVLSPGCTFLIFWSFLFMFVLTYDLFTMPLQVFDLPKSDVFGGFNFFCMMFWSLDIPLTMNTAIYTSNGEVRYLRREILCSYLKGWLILDLLIASMDWMAFFGDSVGGGALKSGRAVKAFRVLRVLRILRMRKLREVLQSFDEFINSPYFTIICSMIVNVALMLMISHFLGCFWFMIGKNDIDGYPSWVTLYNLDEASQADWEYAYLTSLHWSITQFTPGSMHVQPQNIPERAFAIFVLVTGMIVFSSIVSSITAATNGLKSMNAKYTFQMNIFRRMCKEHGIKQDLLIRITRYADKFIMPRIQKVNYDEVQLMKMLPKTFQMEVLLDVYGRHLMVHPMFAKLAERSCLSDVCASCLSNVVLDTEELLFSPGDAASAMYFVNDGLLAYHVFLGNPNQPRTELDQCECRIMYPQDWFGEAVLWTPWVFQGTMSSQNPSVLTAVDSLKFRLVLRQHRVDFMVLKRYSKEYVRGMNDLAGFFTDEEDDDSNLPDYQIIESAIAMLDAKHHGMRQFHSNSSNNGGMPDV